MKCFRGAVVLGAAVITWSMFAGITAAQEGDDAPPPGDEPRSEAGEDRGDRPGRPDRPGREEMRRRMLERFDADGNGELSDEERAKAREEREQMGRGDRRRGDGPPRDGRSPRDRGPDGRRGPERGPDGPGPGPDGPGPGGPPPRGPGFPPNPMRLFNAFDEDKNEQLNKDEFEKLMGRLRELMPPPPRPDGPGPRFRGGPDGPDGRGPGFGEGRPPRPREDGEGPRGRRRPPREGEEGDRPRRPEGEQSTDAPADSPAADDATA